MLPLLRIAIDAPCTTA